MRVLSQHLPLEVNGRARAEPAGAPVFHGQPVVDVQRLEVSRWGHVEVLDREPVVWGVLKMRLITKFLISWPAGLSRLFLVT